MVSMIQEKITNFKIEPAVAKTVTDVDIARVYIDSLYSTKPVANFFGGDILEPIFDWLYFPVDWNTNNFGCLLYTSPSPRD